jgi:inward rectifier potassium channel
MGTSRNRRLKDVDNSGFSGNTSTQGGRLLNRDGSTNLRKTGMPFYMRFSMYHSLLKMSSARFLLMVFLFYTVINLVFACIYLAIGIDKLSGTAGSSNFFINFSQAFFFSSQTMTTVGYGHVAPSGLVANTIASIESFLGIMTFALVTGMFYARFSRPKAFIRFSENFIIAPYKEGRAVMFRLATYKNNELTDVEAQVTLAMQTHENGSRMTRFFPVKLEIARINSLALSWTCVHPIDEESPLFNMLKKDLEESNIEIMITIKGFDDHFSNTVQQRTSYTFREMVYGAKFLPMYERSASGDFTELRLNKVNDHELYVFEEELAAG